MDDNVGFIHVEHNNQQYYLFTTDQFLYPSEDKLYGKLIYSSVPIHGSQSIPCTKSLGYYKVAYKIHDNKTTWLIDKELALHAVRFGFTNGNNLDQYLCQPPVSFYKKYQISPSICSMYSDNQSQQFVDSLAKTYKVDPELVALTGSLHLFPKPIKDAHDVDIVIPISSIAQLKHIQRLNQNIDHLEEYGITWPLRWKHRNGYIICPFFYYKDMLPPVISIQPQLVTCQTKIVVTDTMYGIFNMPVYLTHGEINVVIFRSTFIRGFIRSGQTLTINCRTCIVTAGLFKGAKAAYITDPFTELTNLSEIINS